ncbi:hypothetical protein GQ43DRAFT_429991 [Delitschia confertaspora ATCC 74209]|uniref:Serine-rich protein n=1 Tax=Delitschia confertaspora ATCC 74209 TaxID=1513339 RepID=A0A9P4JQG8_9PLEO|nr:hypothetical protein GQ43DRAFT_429991 [Delitschia confertaspora ATCC 74209]
MPFNNPDPLPTTKRSASSASSSPFQYLPTLSPSASRRTSPARRPLHERSNSQSNRGTRHSGSTIRLVEDPGTEVYSKRPFPDQPSQLLPPRNAPGYAFESRGSHVSDATRVANAASSIESSQTLVPKPLQPKRAVRHSASTSNSDADTLVAASPFSSSFSRFSQGTTPPLSPAPYYQEKERELEIVEEQPSQTSHLTIRAVPPSSCSNESDLQDHALTPRASAASLTSTESSDSLDNLIVHERDTSVAPQPVARNHERSPSSESEKKKQASSTHPSSNPAPEGLASKTSAESLPCSDISYESSANIQIHYPVVRQPSASILWAESHVLPKNPSRMNNRASHVHQWSSQLSTIASESERGSRSIDRRSQSVDQSLDHASSSNEENSGRTHIPRRRRTITSATSSENIASETTESSVSVPLPLFSPITRPSDTGDSDEHHDTISPLQSPPMRQKRSGFLRRHDSNRSSTSQPESTTSRPGSSQSDLSTFIANTIPAWARVYYRRGERTSLHVPDTSTEASESVRIPTANSNPTNSPSEGSFPMSIYRPRNRPHQRQESDPTPHTNSMAISEAPPAEQEVYVIGPPRRHLTEPFTPRLRQDRRSTARLSAWKAPSIDETLGTLFFNRQNRQLLLFCLGFLCPFSWMIASFLPLPQDPSLAQETPSQLDLERQYDEAIGPVDDRSYLKAKWWRNVNRIMSVVGTILLAVIIALAVVASRMAS